MPSALGALSTAGHHSGEDTVAEDERDMDKHNDGEEEEDEEEEAEAEEGDVEYEEIEEEIEVEEEVEEEIEVEEEVEEEVEVEEESEEEEFEEVEEIEEEELSGSPINEELNEVCQVVESKGHEVLPESDYSVREKCVANPPSDILPVGGIGNSKSFDTSERRDKGESTTDVDSPKCQRGEKYLVVPEDGRFQVSTCDEKESISFPERGTPSHDDACKNINTSLCDSRIMPAETSEQLIVSVEEATAAIPAGGVGKETNIAGCPEAEIGKTDAQSREEGMHQGPTSLIVPQIRPRSLSPVSEFNDGNKRPAVICNFFAKGWCIKGNSCRFLHIKDNVNSTTQKHEGDVTTLGLQADGGLGGGTDRPKSAYFLNTSTPSVTCSSSLSLERTPSVEHGESPRWNPSSKDCVSEGLKQNCPIDTSQGTAIPPHASSLEEMLHRKNQCMMYDRCSPVLSGLLNSSFSPSLPTSRMSQSDRISAWTRPSFSFSSLDTDPLGDQKLSESIGEYSASRSASLMQSSSPFSGFESNLCQANVSANPLLTSEYRAKFSSYDWEPSKPFRPSFFITQSLLSSGIMYDPLRDSIEQPNIGGGFSKFSLIPEMSIAGKNLNIDGHIGPENGSDKYSTSGHSKLQDNLSDNNFQGKDLFTSQEKAVRTSHTDQKNGIIFPQEEKSLSPFHVKDASNLDSDPGNQKDGQRQKKESKINVFGQDHEIGFDLKIDGERKESKALKHFRAALIEFVKEFVKPAWREGLISKDAHKIIVKKAVHKVLSTLQPRQTPNTPELIKQYLSASEPKISKLVEGYVVKYGKP